MLPPHANRAIGDGAVAKGSFGSGKNKPSLNSQRTPAPQAIVAQLTGSSQCRAGGYICRSASPVLGLCRKLVSAGFSPDRPLWAYRAIADHPILSKRAHVHVLPPSWGTRGKTLCLKIRSIGEAAWLEVNSSANGFCLVGQPRRALPMRANGGRAP
jgi:hypothetical protein